jgi:hypothetical protein
VGMGGSVYTHEVCICDVQACCAGEKKERFGEVHRGLLGWGGAQSWGRVDLIVVKVAKASGCSITGERKLVKVRKQRRTLRLLGSSSPPFVSDD